MNTFETIIVAIVAILVLALILFMILRNKKDRKELLPTDGADPVEEEIIIQERKRDRI